MPAQCGRSRVAGGAHEPYLRDWLLPNRRRLVMTKRMHLAFDLSYIHMDGRWRMPGAWPGRTYPIRPPGTPNVRMVLVGDSADAADDWIAEHISAVDICVTSDIPLASRCLKKTSARPLPYRQTVDAGEYR
jgi:hypothetical protein